LVPALGLGAREEGRHRHSNKRVTAVDWFEAWLKPWPLSADYFVAAGFYHQPNERRACDYRMYKVRIYAFEAKMGLRIPFVEHDDDMRYTLSRLLRDFDYDFVTAPDYQTASGFSMHRRSMCY
jgi:hypothetical protein